MIRRFEVCFEGRGVEVHRCWCYLVKEASNDTKDGRAKIASVVEEP